MNASLIFRRALPLGALLAAALLAGCASAPDRYYTLSAPASAATVAGAAVAPAPALAIEFAPVGMPERLARPQMLVRRADSAEVQVLEQHRWASSLDQELRDALSAGVARRLGAADVTRGGRTPGQAVWRVAVQVQDLDAVEGEQVSLALQWRLRRPDGSDAGGCSWRAQEAAGAGMEGVAAAAQRLAARATEAMAAQIRAVQGGGAVACGA